MQVDIIEISSKSLLIAEVKEIQPNKIIIQVGTNSGARLEFRRNGKLTDNYQARIDRNEDYLITPEGVQAINDRYEKVANLFNIITRSGI